MDALRLRPGWQPVKQLSKQAVRVTFAQQRSELDVHGAVTDIGHDGVLSGTTGVTLGRRPHQYDVLTRRDVVMGP